MNFLSQLFKFIFPVFEVKKPEQIQCPLLNIEEAPLPAVQNTENPSEKKINIDTLIKEEIATIRSRNEFIEKTALLFPKKDKYTLFKFLRACEQFMVKEIDIVTYENRLFKMGFVNEKVHQNTHPRFLDNR